MDVAAPQPDTEPNWLNPDEMDTWLSLLGLLIKLPAELDADMHRLAGITQFEYAVMAGLSEAPRRTLRISVLAGLARGSLSRLSHLIKRLERRGWVRREPCPEDGRFTNAILTDSGYAKVAATAPGHVESVRRLVIDALTAGQRRQLREISTHLLKQLDDSDGCPRVG